MPTHQFKSKFFILKHHLAVKFYQLWGEQGKSLANTVSREKYLV